MANPTTNFGWQMPQNTDLVKDLPADFEVFGQAVDTDLADLKGGTTGQVLSKTSNTDLDFTWVTPTDQTPLTTKGDLFTFTTVDARLGVGADGTVLTADSAEASGLKWATPAAGGKVLQVIQGTHSTQVSTSSSTYADTGLTASITPSATASKVLVLVSHQNVFVTGGAGVYGKFRLYRGATNIQDFGYLIGRSTSGIDLHDYAGTVYLDSPSTTSATTYKTQWASFNNNSQVILNNGSVGQATITLMEIGA